MARTIADRVQETSTTSGTGALDLDGAKTGFQTFVSAVSGGAEVYYVIVAVDSNDEPTGEWEAGKGQVTDAAPDTLSRDTVLASSNAGSLVNFGAGTKNVFLDIPSEWYTDRQNVGAELLHVRDEKSTGTMGGDSAASTWNTRDLNTEKTNQISGASLASNQVTLPAGTYRLEAHAPAFRVNDHRLRWRNITDTETTLLGPGVYNDQGTDGDGAMVALKGRFTITAEKTFELQHYTIAGVTDGLGRRVGDGETEVFAEVWIKREPID